MRRRLIVVLAFVSLAALVVKGTSTRSTTTNRRGVNAEDVPVVSCNARPSGATANACTEYFGERAVEMRTLIAENCEQKVTTTEPCAHANAVLSCERPRGEIMASKSWYYGGDAQQLDTIATACAQSGGRIVRMR